MSNHKMAPLKRALWRTSIISQYNIMHYDRPWRTLHSLRAF